MDSGFTVENVIRWLGSVNTHHPRRTLRSMREASHDDTNKVRNRARACGANKPTSQLPFCACTGGMKVYKNDKSHQPVNFYRQQNFSPMKYYEEVVMALN